ncbi:MAG TPA: hypothetical protein VM938_10590 [Acidimicrobiales bacterium]|nr:hypothetical protein [Acidimicrobiales bacterium]
MARGKGRGGSRTPSSPAAVSGPGALSRRTDSQPVRPVPGGTYGDRKATVEQQQAAPMASAPTPQGAPPQAGPAGVPIDPRSIDPFGPTARPNEPLTTGAEPLAGGTPNIDVVEHLRALYARYPSEDLREVLEDAETGAF